MKTAGLLFLIAMLVETVRAALFARFPAHPDLLLGVLVLFALGRSPVRGAVAGFALGGLRDIVYGHPLGMEALPFAVIGWGVGSLGNTVYREALITRGVVLFVAAVGSGLVRYLSVRGGDGAGVLFYMLRILLPSAILTAVLVPLVYGWMMGPVRKRIEFVPRFIHAWLRGYEKKVLDKQQ